MSSRRRRRACIQIYALARSREHPPTRAWAHTPRSGGLPSDEELLGPIDNPRNNAGPSDGALFQQSNQGPLT